MVACSASSSCSLEESSPMVRWHILLVIAEHHSLLCPAFWPFQVIWDNDHKGSKLCSLCITAWEHPFDHNELLASGEVPCLLTNAFPASFRPNLHDALLVICSLAGRVGIATPSRGFAVQSGQETKLWCWWVGLRNQNRWLLVSYWLVNGWLIVDSCLVSGG